MKRPEVTLPNYQAVYDWYQSYRQPRPVTKLAYAALNQRYKPSIHFAEGVHDEFSDLRRNGTPQIFVFNHLTNHSDQFVASAVAHQIVPEDIGRTRVLAKDELFHGAQRYFVDMMGAIPTFRKKDHVGKADKKPLNQEEIDQLLAEQSELVDQANEAMFAATGTIVANGENMAVFGEGTHNKVDPAVLQKLRPGFARIALYAYAGGADIAVTPVGMSFGYSLDSLDPRKATVIIAPSLYVSTSDTPETLVDATRESLQQAVIQANGIHTRAK